MVNSFQILLLEVRVESIMLFSPYYSILHFFFILPIIPPLLPYYSLNILILRVELFTHKKNFHSNDTLTLSLDALLQLPLSLWFSSELLAPSTS